MSKRIRRILLALPLAFGPLAFGVLNASPAAAHHDQPNEVCVGYAVSTEEMPYDLEYVCHPVPEEWWIECWWVKGSDGKGEYTVYYHVEACIPM
jgi:hypothetical protein